MGWASWILLGAALGAPVTPEPEFVALDVPDFSASLVRLPEGSGKAPVLVVTHGAGGTAEAHCALWARIVKNKALLLCVRGRARGPNPADGEYYPTTRPSNARPSRR